MSSDHYLTRYAIDLMLALAGMGHAVELEPVEVPQSDSTESL